MANRKISEFSSQTNANLATGDLLHTIDISEVADADKNKSITIGELDNRYLNDNSEVDHDQTTNYVANEHVDHSGVTLTAGEGISGGGDITANRSFALDINGITNITTFPGAADLFAIYDATTNNRIEKVNFSNINSSLDHDNLTGKDKAAAGVDYGHIDASAQTLAGVKTFSSFPVTPSAAPTTDYQVANKKYVDDNAGGAVSNHYQFGRWFNTTLFANVSFPPGVNWPDDGTGNPDISLVVDDNSTLETVTWSANTNATTSFTLNVNINGSNTSVGTVTGTTHTFTGLSISLTAGDEVYFQATNITGGGTLKGVCILAKVNV